MRLHQFCPAGKTFLATLGKIDYCPHPPMPMGGCLRLQVKCSVRTMFQKNVWLAKRFELIISHFSETASTVKVA